MQTLEDNLQPSRRSTLELTVIGVQVLLRVAWRAIRLAVYALLVLLEPLVRMALCALALLGLLTALFIRLAANRPDFPFWGTLGLSIGCVLLLAINYAVIRRVARPQAAGGPGG
jgi:hypothetical protein